MRVSEKKIEGWQGLYNVAKRTIILATRYLRLLVCVSIRDVVLPAQLFDGQASLGFLQNRNDLFFGESLLHVHRPLW